MRNGQVSNNQSEQASLELILKKTKHTQYYTSSCNTYTLAYIGRFFFSTVDMSIQIKKQNLKNLASKCEPYCRVLMMLQR